MSEIANKTILELTSLNEYLYDDAIPVLRHNLHEDNCIALGDIIWFNTNTKQLIINGIYKFDMSSLLQANISIELTGDSGITSFTYNGEPYDKGDSIKSEEPFNASITANINEHYTFTKWQFKNADIYDSNPLLYNFTESGKLKAITTIKQYTITVNADSSLGTVSGSGSYDYNASCTITANPNVGYKFVNWTKNGSQVSTNPSHSFTVTENATYTAVFASDTSIPTVTTANVSNITQSTATCGGNITSDGNSTITARGVCWSTSSNPTIEDNHTSDGTGTGSFTSNITGLTLNTTYHVRAYATNSIGTSYGADKTFKTADTPVLKLGFYNGPMSMTTFSNETDLNIINHLITGHTNYAITDCPVNYTLQGVTSETNNIFYILVKENYSTINVKYTSVLFPIELDLTVLERHSAVEIDGVNYKVYAWRNDYANGDKFEIALIL